MSSQITRRLKPEEEEILRKRGELANVKATLAELELELVNLHGELAAFEGRYLRQVGTLYAELDEWKARIAELQARLSPTPTLRAQAQDARDQARQTYEDSHGEASAHRDFTPSSELKGLFREVAKRIHPDLAKDSLDRERRTRFMAEANRAYEGDDPEALKRILDEYQEGADTVEGEGIGAELVRIIRQISQVKSRISAIEQEIALHRVCEIGLLKKQADELELAGRNLLAELEVAVRVQIDRTKAEHERLLQKDTSA